MNDQENQEPQDFGQVLAEFEQEAPAKSEEPTVGQKVSGKVLSIGDARALLHDGMLYLWSRSGRRCHALRLRPA